MVGGAELTGWLDVVLVVWFALVAISTAYVAWDAFTKSPELTVMKWAWVLVTLYAGPLGAALYVLSCKEPRPGTHDAFVKPMWKQAIGSTIHCVAGDAMGIIAAAAVTSALGLPMWLSVIVEYVLGFGCGLFIFQALCMKDMSGGSYATALRRAVLPEWLSMNALMAGMIPTMMILMSRDMTAMDPMSLRFWGVMSLATLVGAAAAYPINWWLVAVGLKHGMGTAQPHTGDLGAHAPFAVTKPQLAAMSVLSLMALAAGVLIAALLGDFGMRPGRHRPDGRASHGAAPVPPPAREPAENGSVLAPGHAHP